MKKLFVLLLSTALMLGIFAGCSGKDDRKNTLVYGSGDYDSINLIMNEYCEIKHML